MYTSLLISFAVLQVELVSVDVVADPFRGIAHARVCGDGAPHERENGHGYHVQGLVREGEHQAVLCRGHATVRQLLLRVQHRPRVFDESLDQIVR